MKAAVLYGQQQLRIEEVAPRPLAAGELRINIQAALTCGTDLKVFKRGSHAKMIDGECALTRLPELFESMAEDNHAVKTFVRVHE